MSSFIVIKIDINFIDMAIMELSRGFIKTGLFVSRMQNANTRYYAFIMLTGISAISMYLIIKLG